MTTKEDGMAPHQFSDPRTGRPMAPIGAARRLAAWVAEALRPASRRRPACPRPPATDQPPPVRPDDSAPRDT